jgi:hypothetical protein
MGRSIIPSPGFLENILDTLILLAEFYSDIRGLLFYLLEMLKEQTGKDDIDVGFNPDDSAQCLWQMSRSW